MRSPGLNVFVEGGTQRLLQQGLRRLVRPSCTMTAPRLLEDRRQPVAFRQRGV